MESVRRPARLWDEAGWPVLTGLAVATGLWWALVTLSPLFVLGLVVALDLAVTPLAQALGAAFGTSMRRAALSGAPRFTLAVVTCLGLVGALRLWALPVLAVLAVSSPGLRPLVSARARRRTGVGSGTPPPRAAGRPHVRRPVGTPCTHGSRRDRRHPYRLTWQLCRDDQAVQRLRHDDIGRRDCGRQALLAKRLRP